MSRLSISIVVFRPDLAGLSATLRSVRTALESARAAGAIETVGLSLVDNGSEDEPALDEVGRSAVAGLPWIHLEILRGHGNVGYGRGHNLAILASGATYHLILNPDVILDLDAITESVRFLERHPDVGLLAPRGYGPDGERHYLCRLYPTVCVLYLRGFAPDFLRRWFSRYMSAHEMREVTSNGVVKGVPVVHGCYMFTRLPLLQKVGGFSPDYFLYFEDTDLSLRLGKVASLAFAPQVSIVHYGGGAARKGLRHIVMFVRSAFTFFQTHGWKVV